MHPIAAFVVATVVLSVIFTLVWARQRTTKNAGMVDPVWSFCLGGLAVFYALVATGDPTARLLTGILGGLWGARLGTFLFFRNTGKPEDGRYRRFRDEWGDKSDFNMFWFFQFQVVLAMLLSLGFLVACYRPSTPNALEIVATIALMVISVAGEAIADAQLGAFKKVPDNKGRVCRVGLWRYSRHPNYFFECMHWPAYTVLAIGAPWFFLTLIPPFIMWFLLLRVSGIPMTEAQTAKTRPEYAEYIATTSPFFPWPPRSSSSVTHKP
jgi:steroid 5-alpha reductase family enzyme